MAMMCVNGGECTGCMACQESQEYYCPVCGEEVYDVVYVSDDGEIIGCENCVTKKEPWEVSEE